MTIWVAAKSSKHDTHSIVVGCRVGAALVGSGICVTSGELGALLSLSPSKLNLRRNREVSPDGFFEARLGRIIGSGRGSGSITIDV